jgi:hypothetical protein
MIDMEVRIRLAFGSPFFMDLLVYTPEYRKKRFDLGDWFVREVLDKGLVLYDNGHPRRDLISRSSRKATNAKPRPTAAPTAASVTVPIIHVISTPARWNRGANVMNGAGAAKSSAPRIAHRNSTSRIALA